MTDQEIRAAALEAASRAAACADGHRYSSIVLRLAADFENYIRDGR